MSASKELKSRWLPKYDVHSLPIRKQLHNVLDAHDSIAAKRLELRADPNLSDVGRAGKLKEFAATEASRFAKASRTLEMAKSKSSSNKLALLPAVKDRTDVVGFLARQEQRVYLRSLSEAKMTEVLSDPKTPTSMLESFFELEHLLPAIAPEVRERMIDDVLARTAGPQMVALREHEQAIELLDAAVRVASNTFQQAAAVPVPLFGKWIEEVAPVDPKEVDAETAAFNSDVVTASAKALPFEARRNLIDQLLAANVAEVAA
jgi:hypothetical protein